MSVKVESKCCGSELWIGLTECILLVLSTFTDAKCAIVLSYSAIHTIPKSLVHGYCECVVAANVKIDEESLVVFVGNEF